MFRVSCAIIVPYHWVQYKEMFLRLGNRWRRNPIQHVPPNLRKRSQAAAPAAATAAAPAADPAAGPVALHHPIMNLASFK